MIEFRCPVCRTRVTYDATSRELACPNGHPFDPTLVLDDGKDDPSTRDGVEPIEMTTKEMEEYGRLIRPSPESS